MTLMEVLTRSAILITVTSVGIVGTKILRTEKVSESRMPLMTTLGISMVLLSWAIYMCAIWELAGRVITE